MKPWRVYMGRTELRDGQQVVTSEELCSEHDDYRSAVQAAKAHMEEWKANPETSPHPVRFRIDGDFTTLHGSGQLPGSSPSDGM
jgi:hypothetical protein